MRSHSQLFVLLLRPNSPRHKKDKWTHGVGKFFSPSQSTKASSFSLMSKCVFAVCECVCVCKLCLANASSIPVLCLAARVIGRREREERVDDSIWFHVSHNSCHTASAYSIKRHTGDNRTRRRRRRARGGTTTSQTLVERENLRE